uniref:Uncharacterized protein n=1 Tax=candidate division WOR-3 bacterium TaxID=2052148 RepID=A0A7C6AEY9_UNCW3
MPFLNRWYRIILLVKKYFNPLKPDSARITFAVIPQEYADPETPLNPISLQVEIRDCDSNIVYVSAEFSNPESFEVPILTRSEWQNLKKKLRAKKRKRNFSTLKKSGIYQLRTSQ